MSRHRPIALLLLITLLTALLPVAGEGCRLCGKIGRCCCFTRMAARPAAAHCSMMKGACSLDRSASQPAGLRAPQTLPERTGDLAGLFAALVRPEPTALLAAPQAPRVLRLAATPPTPPPRVLRIV
ncbi:MAG TPA: hypothetical protein VH988_28935 [Thermoanaerobaculia bacterium]|jgi:hypothetical protein|nr:hypothetical protein [Thermoanaerobaculia bacterium]